MLKPRNLPIPQCFVTACQTARNACGVSTLCGIAILLVGIHHITGIVRKQIDEEFPSDALLAATNASLPSGDADREIRLGVVEDEIPEFPSDPSCVSRLGVHLVLDHLLQPQLHTQDQTEQAIGNEPVLQLTLIRDDVELPSCNITRSFLT